MNTIKKSALAIVALLATGMPLVTNAQSLSKGKVLVVMSSANELQLKDGKQYKTGVLPERVRDSLQEACRGGLYARDCKPQGRHPGHGCKLQQQNVLWRR